MTPERFRDRIEGGEELAKKFLHLIGRSDVVILGLPRGGVPVAFALARRLSLPLDVLLVRKLGVPGREELAMGAIAAGAPPYLNQEVIDALQIPAPEIQRVVERETRELERRALTYRGDRSFFPLAGKVVVLVDDGLATGSTMQAAVRAIRAEGPSRIIVAVPVASLQAIHSMSTVANEIVCLSTPIDFQAVGEWYDDFSQTTDEEVRDLLQQSHSPATVSAG